ncbi:hypothetical protein DPX16_8472 [Anabarilius grahami]|uniref:Uncharacterized protein n=1 Tax=Anabarilius grahami TaxID=495550 RepID=A0A3N0Z318_ANAGA|nr:hypothetical protein DPX16_8472 [Anabarilius grahami]
MLNRRRSSSGHLIIPIGCSATATCWYGKAFHLTQAQNGRATWPSAVERRFETSESYMQADYNAVNGYNSTGILTLPHICNEKSGSGLLQQKHNKSSAGLEIGVHRRCLSLAYVPEASSLSHGSRPVLLHTTITLLALRFLNNNKAGESHAAKVRIVSNGVQPYIVQTGVDTDGETQEEVTAFRMKLDVSERYAAKPSSSFESDAVADVLNVFYDSEQSTTGGGTGEINRLNERKTDQSRERS